MNLLRWTAYAIAAMAGATVIYALLQSDVFTAAMVAPALALAALLLGLDRIVYLLEGIRTLLRMNQRSE